jgi:hypothetical protein
MNMLKGCRGRDRMGVRLTTTCAVSAYHHLSLWIRITLMVRCTRYNIMWLSLSVIFSWYSTNKTNRHDITEILFIVPLNTITLTTKCVSCRSLYYSSWSSANIDAILSRKSKISTDYKRTRREGFEL